jgi:hypothetical protein
VKDTSTLKEGSAEAEQSQPEWRTMGDDEEVDIWAIGLLTGRIWARTFAIVLALCSALAMVVFLPHYPCGRRSSSPWTSP